MKLHGFSNSTLARREGFVLPVVLFALVILGVVAIAALWTSDDERRSERAFKESEVALYAAETGLRNALGTWSPTAVAALQPGDSLVVGGGWTSTANHASYRGVIYRVDNNKLQQYVVIAQGRRPSGVGGEATVTALVSGVPIFKWGIFTQGNISLSGGAITDGYNSANGPYNPAAIDSTGSVAANGSILLSGGSTTVNGDATAAGTNSGGIVTGTRTASAPALPTKPILACPAGGFTPASDVPGGSGISYTAATGVLTVSGGKNLTLGTPAAGYFYFSSVTLSGNSTITVTAGHTDIWISDFLNISGGTIVNTSTLPPALSFWSCGTASTNMWTLSGGSGAYFSVYAPNHPITVSGGGDIYGAIVGAALTSSGGAKIHFDEALMNSASKNVAIVSGSWAELSAF